MRNVLRRHPSAAMVVAVIALIAALTGTAVAGSKFLSTGKFQSFKRNANARINAAVRGPIAYSSVTESIPTTPVNGVGTDISAPCPPGTVPTGGGIKVSSDRFESVNDSHPSTVGWSGTVFNTATAPLTATVTAACAASASTGARTAP
jgi:hypothetical protein